MKLFLCILCILALQGVSSKKLTRRENRILKANCGRYVEGFQDLNGYRKNTSEEYKALYGKDVKIGEAPWAVSLSMKRKSRSGRVSQTDFAQHGTGTLISPWHIVTAAHLIGISMDPHPDCETGMMNNATFLRDFKDFVAFVNVTCAVPEMCKGLRRKDVFKPYGIQSLYIRKGYVGDGCEGLESYNDVAVFELKEPIEFSRNVIPACLPSAAKPPRIGARGYKIYGFGRDPSDQTLESGKLKTLESTVTECSDGETYEGLYCTSANNRGLSCDGDSGSGVVRTSDTRNVEELVGILSAGVNCIDFFAEHQSSRSRKESLRRETDLLVDVSRHLDFFCNCCGVCNK